jgi:hypothetical protein
MKLLRFHNICSLHGKILVKLLGNDQNGRQRTGTRVIKKYCSALTLLSNRFRPQTGAVYISKRLNEGGFRKYKPKVT